METITVTVPLDDEALLRDAADYLDRQADRVKREDDSLPVMDPAADAFGNTPPAPPTVDAPASVTDGQPLDPASVGGELDANGRAWDGRIHTEAKTKLKSGAWKLRRGVDKALVAQIEAGQPQLADTSPAPPATDTSGYIAIRDRVNDATAANLISPQVVLGMLSQLGVASMVDLEARPDLWDSFNDRLDMVLGPA